MGKMLGPGLRWLGGVEVVARPLGMTVMVRERNLNNFSFPSNIGSVDFSQANYFSSQDHIVHSAAHPSLLDK
jgi:hypothetical protein